MAKASSKRRMTGMAPRTRPLLARPGARFACTNDGLCCTDLHALGPMTRSEAVLMRKLRPGSVIIHEDVEAPCMRYGAGGGCAQIKNGLCSVHAELGPEKKPGGCRRFPYGLVRTPLGGRITTEHRCPCRTLGERPPLDAADAAVSLLDSAGRLEADNEAPPRISITYSKGMPFAQYAAMEAVMLERLARGERAEEVLNADALPEMHEKSWPVWAAGLYESDDGSRGGVALSWFADFLLALATGSTPPERPRPWRDAFERGAKRAKNPERADVVINDWIADELWMIRGLGLGVPFDVARAELATRLAVVRAVIERLKKQGVREDQAAAEAIMMAELTVCSEHWEAVVDDIANDPSPARS
jgi:hypothetical protein